MAAMQPTDVRASFLFMAYPNVHHKEWLGSTTMTRDVALDCVTVSCCYQLVIGPNNALGHS